MTFSIIVPIYNVESYLGECLDSILNQTYQDFEIICIDDSSTDQSFEVLSKYAERYDKINVISNSRNEGLSFSRNRGINEAKGDYILFVDSDDILCLNALSILRDTIQNDYLEMVNFRYLVRNEGRVAIEQNVLQNESKHFSEHVRTGQDLFKEMAQKNLFINPATCSLYKRDFLLKNQLKFYEGIWHEDVLFFFDCVLIASKVVYIHEFLYVYRRRDCSISSTINEISIDSLSIILGKVITKWYNYELEDGMDEAINIYVSKCIISLLNKMTFLYPDYKKLIIGTATDQFVFDLYCGIKRGQNYYVQLSDSELEKIRNYNKIIIYGAGAVASEAIIFLRNHNINVTAVAVSDKGLNRTSIADINIYQIEELISMRESALILVAVLKRSQLMISHKLESLGFKNVIYIDTDRAGLKTC